MAANPAQKLIQARLVGSDCHTPAAGSLGMLDFGVLPLTFADPSDFERLEVGDVIEIKGIRAALEAGSTVAASVNRGRHTIRLRHDLSRRQVELLLRGGVINWLRDRMETAGAAASPTSQERATA